MHTHCVEISLLIFTSFMLLENLKTIEHRELRKNFFNSTFPTFSSFQMLADFQVVYGGCRDIEIQFI